MKTTQSNGQEKMVKIELTNVELLIASQVGAMRRVASIQRHLTNQKQSNKSQWEIDIDGAAAEMAVAKYLNVYWLPTVNAGKAADVSGFQVRSTTREYGSLIIRENDVKNEKYILVISQAKTFIIVGWIWCDEGKQEKFWKTKDENGLPAWWVPQSELKPMETINGG